MCVNHTGTSPIEYNGWFHRIVLISAFQRRHPSDHGTAEQNQTILSSAASPLVSIASGTNAHNDVAAQSRRRVSKDIEYGILAYNMLQDE
jgi:hypothetical protein